MKNESKKRDLSSQSGVAPIMVLLFIFAFIGLLLGLDYGYVYYLEQCGDTPINTCFSGSTKKTEEQSAKPAETKTPVTAKGSISFKTYSVSVSMTFPLEGGVVNGTVDGDCAGTVNGTYTGGESGAVSGQVFGSCTPFLVPIPAKATFTGNVNKQQKTVLINGTGGAAGFSGSGSMNLSF